MAVTGAISISCSCALQGTVAYDVSAHTELTSDYIIEHPLGEIRIALKATVNDGDDLRMEVQSASVVRTARLLFLGLVRVPNQGLARVAEGEEYREMNQQFRELYQGVLKVTLPIKTPRALGATALKLRLPEKPAIRFQALAAVNARQFGGSTLRQFLTGSGPSGFVTK